MEATVMLTVAGVDRYDMVNTPGSDGPAFTVFFSGCNIRCGGCHNRKLWDKSCGTEYSAKALFNMIDDECKRLGIDNIVLMGGEPLDQDHRDIRMFCALLNREGYKIWLYTGYDIRDIPEYMISWAEAIKYGRYDSSLAVDGFPSSSNQHMMVKVHNMWKHKF